MSFKFIKNFDFTFVGVKTYIKSLSVEEADAKSNKHRTVHKSKAGGFLTLLFFTIIGSYLIYLFHKMYSDVHNQLKSQLASNSFETITTIKRIDTQMIPSIGVRLNGKV